MPKFNSYVSVYKDPATHEEFAPGDEVPDWALDKVGDHVIDDKNDEEDVRLTDPHYEDDEPAVQFRTSIKLPPTRDVSMANDVDSDDTEGPYDAMSKAELQEEAESRGLAKSGTKDELIARLEEDDEDDSEE